MAGLECGFSVRAGEGLCWVQMHTEVADLAESLARTARGEIDAAGQRALSDQGIATLNAAAEFLERQELSIDAVERIEDVVKQTLARLATNVASLDLARDLAVSMKRLGFFHKLKSYAVKAASPLGYSVFFQRPGEGFSFQRHISHKVEIFQIVSAPPGSYVFACDYDSWKALYEPDRFQRWLEGAADPALERFRHVPKPGDVIVIDRLNVVHTVIGCVLEEFATVSTDMVDRLFDQNAGRSIPPDFPRARVNALLAELPEVEPQRIYELGSGGLSARPQVAELHAWGELRTIRTGPLTARHLVIRPGATTDPVESELEASSLFVRSGRGKLLLGSDAEGRKEVDLEPGALTLVPAGVRVRFLADPGSLLRASQQSLPLRTAFGKAREDRC